MKSLLKFFILLILCASCSNSNNLAIIIVSETAGFDRQLDYVNDTILFNRALSENEMLVMTDTESEAIEPILQAVLVSDESGFAYAITFPIKISANQTKNFKIGIEEKMRSSLPVQLMLSENKLSVENQYYKIHFSDEDDKRGGQINGVELKGFEGQLLNRGHIAMHWAPNFSKSDSEAYFNLEDLQPNSNNSIERNSYQVIKERSGIADSVPEIHVEGRYEFYADLPYFLFESTMTMNKDVELDLLRNDEMTMDSLFTHVAYPKKDGSIEHLRLYNKELDVLEENPITDDADWVAFYNLDNGYGFGSIRLNYNNSNLKGQPSPTHKPYTKISRASENGRYWNRVLSDTIQNFPKGSRYYEKNAYLIFQVDAERPEKELVYFQDCLKNPLIVSVTNNL